MQSEGAFVKELRVQGSHPAQIELVSMHVSPGFMGGAHLRLSGAGFTFAHFHSRRFRSFRNFYLMALLKAGKLQLDLPSLSPA